MISPGVYCCGPCPVKAIKEGELGAKYDAPFVYAEVNADIIHWIVKTDGQRTQVCFCLILSIEKYKKVILIK